MGERVPTRPPERASPPDAEVLSTAASEGVAAGRLGAILGSVSAQVVGIILSLFSIVMAVVIYVGGFSEEKRANVDFEKAPPLR